MRQLLKTIFGRAPTSEELFEKAILQASEMQRLGYDIGFSFLPRFPDMPYLSVCEGRFGAERLTGIGYDCFDRSLTFVKTLSETLERALWNDDMLYWREHSMQASEGMLTFPALPLTDIAGFSDAQRRTLPRLAFDARTEFLWSRGVRLSDMSSLFIPAQLVSGKYAGMVSNHEPMLRMSNSNGIATHTSFDEAARRGLLELIERDAFMITFNNMLSVPRIEPSSIRDEKACAIISELHTYGFEFDLLLLATDMPVTAVCCTLRDPSGKGPALVIGARADEDPSTAVVGALTEALGVYYLARAGGRYKKPTPKGTLTAVERIAFWAKQENAPTLAWLWSGAHVPIPRGRKRMSASTLAKAAEHNGCSVGAISMTPPKLHKTGLHSVCVVSPELQPLNLDSEPTYMGGSRLKSVPQALGYTVTDTPPYTHPFP